MDRLTFEVHDGGIFVKESDVKTFAVEDEIMHTGNAVRKLAEYEDLENQGKLLKLPCAVGDMVYQIDKFDCELCEIERPEINKKCTCKIGDFCGYEEITAVWFKLDMLDNFGKTVFLTKKEAEAALKEMGEKKV